MSANRRTSDDDAVSTVSDCEKANLEYHDFASLRECDIAFVGSGGKSIFMEPTNASATFTNSSTLDDHSFFPSKLHHMLNELEKDGHGQHIVCWQPHGRAFIVRKQSDFVKHALPHWFRQTKFASFLRQLNLYGFRRITTGVDQGSYYHEMFLRGKPFLAKCIQRIKVKGNGPRKASSPETEPNFYLMPRLMDRHKDAMVVNQQRAAAEEARPAVVATTSHALLIESSPVKPRYYDFPSADSLHQDFLLAPLQESQQKGLDFSFLGDSNPSLSSNSLEHLSMLQMRIIHQEQQQQNQRRNQMLLARLAAATLTPPNVFPPVAPHQGLADSMDHVPRVVSQADSLERILVGRKIDSYQHQFGRDAMQQHSLALTPSLQHRQIVDWNACFRHVQLP